MKKFIGIVGFAKADKSTIIQSLTGCSAKNGIQVVRDEKTGKKVLVLAASAQENAEVNKRFKLELRSAATRRSMAGVVAAIQPTRPYERLGLEDMLKAAKENGFEPHLFVLDPARSTAKRTASLAYIRKRVGKFIRIDPLDGRRFAYLNAKRVARLTSLFDA